jgi:5-methylcytosine-specific restriction protein B
MENSSINWRTALQDWEKNNSLTMSLDVKQLRDNFINSFSLEKIAQLTLEDYCIGNENHDGFCYWLEYKTRPLGGIGGGTSQKFGVWWDKENNQYQYIKKFNCNDANQALTIIKNGLSDLLSLIQSNRFKEADEYCKKNFQQGSNMFVVKTMFLYFPENILPIFSQDHLIFLISKFELDKQGDFYESNHQLLSFLKNKIEFKKYDTVMMVQFLYDYWPPDKQKSFTLPKNNLENNQNAIKYNLVKLEKISRKTKNIILQGVPGVGKTYLSQQFAESLLEKQLNLFSLVEDLKKDVLKNLKWYEVIAIVLYKNKNSQKKYRASEIKEDALMQQYWPLTKTNKLENMIQAMLQSHTDPSIETVKYKNRQKPFLFEKDEESNWSLTDQGIEYVRNNLESRIEELKNPSQDKQFLLFITFHQSLSYEEFIEGIKPQIDGNGNLTYPVVDGIFKKICRQAETDLDRPYILIIDEINRANIAKVFGELITLIEDDKRGKIPVTLPYSRELFTVPENLYIIGTMNTADRSIALLDIALRRRFAFVEVLPDPSLLKPLNGIDLTRLLKSLNQQIINTLGRDYQIGHSYFLNLETQADLEFTWYYRVIPLLQEYYYSDLASLQKILGDFIVTENNGKNGRSYRSPSAYNIRQELTGEEFTRAIEQLQIPNAEETAHRNK